MKLYTHTPKTVLYAALSTGTLTILLIVWLFVRPWCTPLWQPKETPEDWLIVFVHGTFNFPLSLLNIVEVLQDNVDNTQYSTLVKRMRKDPYFLQEQPILQRGLLHIQPTLHVPENPYKFAAYPLLACYDTIYAATKSTIENRHYYTFGWSGLLSARHRRREAVRLYNALQEEQARYAAQGKKVKIRLIAHSHGGNLCLNIAAINQARTMHPEWNATTPAIDDTIQFMKSYLATLPTTATQVTQKGQKKFDYQPSGEQLIIDELITLGNPIQPETMSFFAHPTFRTAYNFYSAHDAIQGVDVLSTKQRISAQRIEVPASEHTPHIIQAKIMVNHPIEESEIQVTPPSWWSWIIGTPQLPTTYKLDPTHKDLWFLAWSKDFTQENFPLHPLPVVVILPLLIRAIEHSNEHDVDLNICVMPTEFVVHVYAHEQKNIIAQRTLNKEIITCLQEKILAWMPTNLSKQQSFDAITTKL